MSVSAVASPTAFSSLPLASANAGSVGALGGGGHAINMKKVLMWSVCGALLGAFVPVIPGGPAGGAIAGAALALFL